MLRYSWIPLLMLASACAKEEPVAAPVAQPTAPTDIRTALLGDYHGTLTYSSYTAGIGSNSTSHDTVLVVSLDDLPQCVNIGTLFQHILITEDLQLSISPPYSTGNGSFHGSFTVLNDSTKLQVGKSSMSPISAWNTSFLGYRDN